MNENFDPTELEIINEFNQFLLDVEKDKISGDRNWTYHLKKRIAELGTRKGYKITVGGFGDEFAGEWLYDLVWFVEDKNGDLTNVPLIVESEWDKKFSGIKFDFEKLLVGNAERRLMICQSSKKDMNELFSKFKNAIDKFQENKNDRFLFAVLNYDTDNEFYFRTYTK